MMDEALVSVIVPIYNVEKYLRICLDTIVNQTYKNLEIILIVDGATDLSGLICQEYQKKDSRVIVIVQENAGLSAARNTGMSYSHGEFIGFVDSDDFIYLDMYEKLVRVMQQTNADIVECQAETVYQDKMYVQQDASFDISELSGYDALEKLMRHVKSEFPRYAVWNKLFRREILYNLNFPVGEIHEDYFFDAVAFLRAKKYVLLNQQLYCHRIRSHSITTTPFNPHDYDKLKHIEQRTVYLLENGWEQLAQYSNTEYYETLLLYYYKAYKAKQMTECDKIKNEIKKSRIKIQNSMLSFKRKCEFKLFYSSPWIFVKYIDLKNRLFKMLKKE